MDSSSPPSPYPSDGTLTPSSNQDPPASRSAPPSAKPANSSDSAPLHDDDDDADSSSSRQTDCDSMDSQAHHSRDAISKLLNGKEKEWTAIAEKKGPLRLLDLPVDILKEIINHLPHTNDLTSLALCHSALHNLTIPYIYSRFDIVWPDSTVNSEQRSGVDALTYGLATLVMGEEIFGESQWQRDQARHLKQTRTPSSAQQRQSAEPFPIPRRRRGNYFARYTKKFSLGNGPVEWVQDYLITKEGGKMLGTLVAVAVARMRNLETFVWDMPTGVLRDVWLALSSLADRDDGQDCRLERLWIRWHDNSGADLSVPPPPMPVSNLPPPPPHAHNASGVGAAQAPIVVPVPHSASALTAIDRVEHPTFSVIPALKSLSVLDIDELPYLDEMAILIGRSQKKLRELRIGIAKNAYEHEREWVMPWEGAGTQQVDHSTLWTAASKIGDKRLGGVLGILVGRVYNLRHNTESQGTDSPPGTVDRVWEHGPSVTKSEVNLPHASGVDGREFDATSGVVPADNSTYQTPPSRKPLRERALEAERREREKNLGPLLNTKLKLETLELERVPMSVPVMLQAFDWSKLTALTLLNCSGHETLWRTLRREFAPRGPQSHVRGSSAKTHSRPEYRLNLKKIHTNTVSVSLISFIKETLPPNSLEVLFLQEDRTYHSNVTINVIFRGALKRHRASLKKVMIDSSEKGTGDRAPTSTRWRRWMLNREIITFITSGRMCNLRELAFCIDYLDWHFFLQRLPQVPTLRSLYIPHIADHAHGNNIDPRELAMQIVDIITLRPEVEICYMGIQNKCFEVLENKVVPSPYDRYYAHHGAHHNQHHAAAGSSGAPNGAGAAPGLGFSDDEDDEPVGIEDEEAHAAAATGELDDEDVDEETEDDDDDVDDDDDPTGPGGPGGGGAGGINANGAAATAAGGVGIIAGNHNANDGDVFVDDEDADEDDDETEDGSEVWGAGSSAGSLDESCAGQRLRLREILFYDDKVAIFKGRHGKL
ncbi:uncharacterized protein J3D65DRAFT_237967 [Phyllosticta citribraziliensis]|uniref:F-box domain-containing protein n=1 Tax=Phyllosticta citribraziliensis TaxID=989973 RepID=A0ABR1LZ90_9PEZI